MAGVTDLATAIGGTLLGGANQPGLAAPIFSYGTNAASVNAGLAGPPAAVAPKPAPTGPSQAQIDAANTAAANQRAATAIQAGYGQVLGTYNNELGDIPGEIQAAGDVVNNQFGSQQKSIDSAYNVGNSNLQFARNQIGTNANRAITKLGQQLRDSFSSYDTLIGNAGAGDSSANGQLSYALQKVGAQNRTDINNNTQDQLGQVTQQQTGLDAQHSDQLQQLNSWKSNQIITIGQQFHSMQQKIEEAKAGATKDELVALAGLNTDLVNHAVAALSGVEASHQQGVADINASLAKLQAPGNAAALSSVNYTPGAAPTFAAPAYSDNGTGSTASFDAAVPYFKKLTPAGA